jgi:hypothetical protein
VLEIDPRHELDSDLSFLNVVVNFNFLLTMTFRLDDHEFPIKKALLWAELNDPYWCDEFNEGNARDLMWAIDIYADRSKVLFKYPIPHVYHHAIQFEIQRWTELSGQTQSWDNPIDEATGEPNGSFVVREHGDILESELTIGERDGQSFQVQWNGLCDRHWESNGRSEAEFSIDTKVLFTEVIVRGNEKDTKESFCQRLAEYLNPDDFIQQEIHRNNHRYQSGILMSDCHFVPKTK